MNGPDILREVDESLRAEKAAKFWKENGNVVLAMVAALIIGTAAQSLWTSYKSSQDEKSTSEFIDALKDKSPVDALLKLSKESKGSGSALAGINGANLAVGKKDWDAAIASYQNVIANKSVSKPYKDLASVQIVSLQLDHDTKKTGADLLATLDPVLNDKESAWNTQAIFVSALVKAQKNNDLKSAQADLEKLLGMSDLPASFLEQIKSLNEVYKIKLGSK